MTATDQQVGGKHYREMAIQPIEFILANNMGFAEGSVIEYVSRWRQKGGLEDLKKALHFLEFITESRNQIADMRHGFRVLKPTITAHKYIEANAIPEQEADIIRWVYFWSHNPNLINLENAVISLQSFVEETRYAIDLYNNVPA